MQQTGVEPSTSEYINSSKVTMGGQTVSLTGEQQALVARIVAEGDQTGMLTENLVESIAKGDSGNFTILSGGKYGSNNGFDLVVQSSDGSLIILDAKQMNSGAFKLGTSYNGQIKLSEGWVEGVLNRLDASFPAEQAIQNFLNNGNLITGVAGVNKSTGELIMLKVTP